MNDAKITYLSSVKCKIITDLIPSLLLANLIFTDKFFSVGINDFEHEIVKQNTNSFGIFNTNTKKRIGILDFSDSSFFRTKAKNKLIWKILLDSMIFEKEAMRVVNTIQKNNSRICVQIITNSKK